MIPFSVSVKRKKLMRINSKDFINVLFRTVCGRGSGLNHIAGEVHTCYLGTTGTWECFPQPAPYRSQGGQSNSHREQGLALLKTLPLLWGLEWAGSERAWLVVRSGWVGLGR